MRVISTVMIAVVIFGAGASGAEPRRVPLPVNVAIDDTLLEDVEEAVAVSPTLQRQFAVVAGAPVIVELRVSLGRLPAFRRAETTITRYDSGFIRARVLIPPGADFIELLALNSNTSWTDRAWISPFSRGRGATQDVSGIFGTVRARDAGRAAALEVELGLRALNARIDVSVEEPSPCRNSSPRLAAVVRTLPKPLKPRPLRWRSLLIALFRSNLGEVRMAKNTTTRRLRRQPPRIRADGRQRHRRRDARHR
jgi:hypothetical protein